MSWEIICLQMSRCRSDTNDPRGRAIMHLVPEERKVARRQYQIHGDQGDQRMTGQRSLRDDRCLSFGPRIWADYRRRRRTDPEEEKGEAPNRPCT